MLEKRNLDPDLVAARQHLTVITGQLNPVVAWQVFCDFDKNRTELAQSFHGTLDEVLPRLLRAQQDGCGVFVAVNRTDGVSRRKSSMTEAQALFLDLDGTPLPGSWPVPPALINQSSNGSVPKFQCWWPIDPTEDFHGWVAFQKLLAAKYDGDFKCTMITQVGRLAGFYHQKDQGNPWLVKTIATDPSQFDIPYTMAELAAPFGFDLDEGVLDPANDEDTRRLEAPEHGWNNEIDIQRAKVFLARESNWHNTNNGEVSVFRAAANLRDLGISEDLAVELIADAIPIYPENWPTDHIEKKVRNAYQYASGEPGSQSIAGDVVDFADEEIDDETMSFGDEEVVAEPAVAEPSDEVDAWINQLVEIGQVPEQDIPLMRWILLSYLLVGDITILAGQGGVGKSMLAWIIGVVVASGKAYGPFPIPEERRVVLILSGEDDVDEVERRVAATCKAMNIDRGSLAPYLLVVPTRSIPLLVKDQKTGKVGHTPLYRNVFQAVRRLKVGLLIADPTVKLGRGFDESSNDDQEALFSELQKLITGDGVVASALLNDHTAKGGANGSQNSVRGAGAKVNFSRTTLLLNTMTLEDFKSLKIDKTKSPTDFVEMWRPKANYAKRDMGGKFFEFVLYALDNGEHRPTLVYRPLLASLDDSEIDPEEWEHHDLVLEMVRNGAPDGSPWRSARQAAPENRLDVALARDAKISEPQARDWLDRFEYAKILMTRNTKVPGNKRNVQCWVINPDYEITEEDEGVRH